MLSNKALGSRETPKTLVIFKTTAHTKINAAEAVIIFAGMVKNFTA
jgi:hypothetical protein